jgi:ribosomal protein S18 acetylase RimI-like enzyme
VSFAQGETKKACHQPLDIAAYVVIVYRGPLDPIQISDADTFGRFMTDKMENITFDDHRPEDQAALRSMIHSLYADDSKGGDDHAASDEHIDRTIERTRSHPDQVQLKIFKVNGVVAGYSLLTNYWSNEHGGLVLILDEVFVLPEFRGKGISSQFFKQLFEMPEYVMVYLEVFPGNTSAFKLYERIGFKQFERTYMYRMQKQNVEH